MRLSDAGHYLATAIVIAGVFFVPRWISARRRLSLGIFLFVAAWAGILAALHFHDLSILQSEAVAYGWLALCGMAFVVGVLFLVTAFFDWLGLTRPRRQRRQFPPFSS
jgi:predicted membrane channel-forming protein YqfA (hemolysin III family)